jgi:hypothetical protein
MFQQMVAFLRYSNVVAESNIRKVYFVPLHHCSCGESSELRPHKPYY